MANFVHINRCKISVDMAGGGGEELACVFLKCHTLLPEFNEHSCVLVTSNLKCGGRII
jgi:hypothetical protein